MRAFVTDAQRARADLVEHRLLHQVAAPVEYNALLGKLDEFILDQGGRLPSGDRHSGGRA